MEDLFFNDPSMGYGTDINLMDDPFFTNVDPTFDPTSYYDVPLDYQPDIVMSQTEIHSIKNDTILPDDMVVQSIGEARHFFGLPDAAFVGPDSQTCIYPQFEKSFFDDVVGFNKEQLIGMGVTTEDALDLVMTHEAAHGVVQDWTFKGVNHGAWEEELACDYFAGVRGGMEGTDMDNFLNAMKNSMGGETHPTGNLRADFIQEGHDFAEAFKAEHGIDPTFEDCKNHLQEHLINRQCDIDASRSTLIDFGLHEEIGFFDKLKTGVLFHFGDDAPFHESKGAFDSEAKGVDHVRVCVCCGYSYGNDY